MLSYKQAKRDSDILFRQFRDNKAERHVFTTMFDYYARYRSEQAHNKGS